MEEVKAKQEEFWFTLLRKEDVQRLWNPELEIIFMLKGAGQIYFAEMKMSYSVKEKDIFVINSFEIHNFELEENAIALSFFVSLKFITSVCPEILKHKINCRSFLHAENKQESFNVIRCDLAQAFENRYKKTKDYVPYSKSRAVAILEDLNRYFLEKDGLTDNKSNWDMIKTAVNYIQCNYKENIMLEDLGKQTFLSETYISRSFKKTLGVPFTDYLALVRLSHAIRLMTGSDTLVKIAFESGFPNMNAMISAFKKYKEMTPGEYRKNVANNESCISGEEKRLEAEPDIFSSLMKYGSQEKKTECYTEQIKEITVPMNARKQKISSHWKRMMNAGYAKSLIDGTIQEELRYIQEKIHFEYIRVKGILDDDMCLLREDMNGMIITNYAYVDEVLDFILSVNAKPMIEIGYMPQILAKEKTYKSMRAGIISAPESIEEWQKLVKALMEHLVQRYGLGKVGKWLFAPWIPPDFAGFGMCGPTVYEDVYVASYDAIKSVDENLLVTGPGCADDGNYLKWFIDMCRRRGCMPEIITFRSYSAIEAEQEESGLKLIGNNESFLMATSGDEDYLQHVVESLNKLLQKEGLGNIPLVLEEWSNNIWQRDLCNDTCFKSAYLFKNILENNQNLSAMGYFALNDRIDEVPPAETTFHGGFGLFTKNNIPKSACRAMELLNQMGDTLVQSGEGYYITQKEDEIQIFLYNYCHYDLLYRYRHMVNMSSANRYQVFVPKESQAFYIQLADMEEGIYEVRRYGITRGGGSSYDEWVKMGAPEPLEQEEQEMLRNLSQPQYQRERVTVEAGERILGIKASLNPLDVWLLRIKLI